MGSFFSVAAILHMFLWSLGWDSVIADSDFCHTTTMNLYSLALANLGATVHSFAR